jgi:hypothetical protein
MFSIRRSLVVLGLAVVVGAPSAALACGILVSPEGNAEMNASRAFLSFDGRFERLVVRIDYLGAGQGEEFAWLMPFPERPEVKAAEQDDLTLAAAFNATEPPLRSEDVPGVIPLVCACGAGGTDTSGGVLLDTQVVGDLEFATLGGSLDEVSGYLDDHGFIFHDRQKPLLADYLQRGWVIVAARALPGSKTSGSLEAVTFSFQTDKPEYPLALAGADHGGQPVRLSLVTFTPWKPTTADFDMKVVRPNNDGEFHDPEGVELRYAAKHPSFAGDGGSIEGGPWLSRIEVGVDPVALDSDLFLQPAADEDPVDFTFLHDKYRIARYAAYGGQVLFTFLLVTPIVLFFAGLVVLIAGISRGGFRRRAS